MQNVPIVFMQSPQGDEIREVQATIAALSPLLSQGWSQVPAPVKPAASTQKETK
jgi:hypothetical protein